MGVSSLFLLAGALILMVLIGSIVFNIHHEHKVQEAADNLVARATRKHPHYAGLPAISGDTLVLIMDRENRQALVANSDGFTKEIPFSDFGGIEINEDGHSVAEASRRGGLGRAAVGGVVAGGAGAIVGALSTGNVIKHREVVSRISVDLQLDDPDFPLLSWTTFSPVFGLENMSAAEVRQARQNAVAFYNQFAPIFAQNQSAGRRIIRL